MTLVRDGLLDLDRPVNEYLTRWNLQGRCAPRATAAALMSHTAGTSVSGFPGYPAGTPIPTLMQILDGAAPANTDAVRADRLMCGWHRYSGGGTTILQVLIEEVSGQSFADYTRTAVLEPLVSRGGSGPSHAWSRCIRPGRDRRDPSTGSRATDDHAGPRTRSAWGVF